MKLVSYHLGSDQPAEAGLCLGSDIISLDTLIDGVPNPRVIDVLNAWDDVRGTLSCWSLGDVPAGVGRLPADTVVLAAPVPRPPSITCVGLNYRDHAEESGQPIPDEPLLFAKKPTSVIATGQSIVLPAASGMVDYEVELAIVIGRTCHRVSEEEALDHVAGFTVLNDVSARDWQMRSTQWGTAKSFDTFCPMGPAIATLDEFDDIHALDIECSVNDTVVQKSNTDQLIFGFARLVSYLSHISTLVPGDVIATGTPGGVGMARSPQLFLKAGDVVTMTISGVGTLTNSVVAETGGAA